MSNKLGRIVLNENKFKWIIGIHGHWTNQNPGGRFGATSWTAPPIQLIWPIFLVNRLNCQCCLAGSSKRAPRSLTFSMAMGADYSFELISIETYAPQFNGHNKSFLGSVKSTSAKLIYQWKLNKLIFYWWDKWKSNTYIKLKPKTMFLFLEFFTKKYIVILAFFFEKIWPKYDCS